MELIIIIIVIILLVVIIRNILNKSSFNPVVKELTEKKWKPGKTSIVKTKNDTLFTVSTLVRHQPIVTSEEKYFSSIEAAVFKGRNVMSSPLIMFEFLGYEVNDLPRLHTLVLRYVSELSGSVISSVHWETSLKLEGYNVEHSEMPSPTHKTNIKLLLIQA